MRIFSGAKVLVEKNIGEERSHSTEVRKERSEAESSYEGEELTYSPGSKSFLHPSFALQSSS